MSMVATSLTGSPTPGSSISSQPSFPEPGSFTAPPGCTRRAGVHGLTGSFLRTQPPCSAPLHLQAGPAWESLAWAGVAGTHLASLPTSPSPEGPPHPLCLLSRVGGFCCHPRPGQPAVLVCSHGSCGLVMGASAVVTVVTIPPPLLLHHR